LVAGLAVCLAASALPPAVFAQDQDDPPRLTLPTEAEQVEQATLITVDDPATLSDAFDLSAAEAEGLRHADMLPAAGWEIAALGETLGGDASAALEFVRDRVALDPYQGVLRGAEGTLAARSGSAADRALLLHALLEASDHTTRYAFADLDADTADQLLADAVGVAPRDGTGAHPADVMTVDAAAILARAQRDHALLTEALADGLASADHAPEAAAQRAALEKHVWVQVQAEDGTWTDLDPSATPPQQQLTEAVTTADEMPDDAHASVGLRIVAETLNEGIAIEETLLDERLSAVEAAGSDVWLSFQPELSGLPGSIVEAMGSAKWAPVVVVDGQGRAGQAFPLGGSGGEDDFFGGFLGSGPELASLRLEIDSLMPSGSTQNSSRVLVDRVDPGDRASGVFDAAMLAPLPEGGLPPAGLGAIHHVMVSNGGTNLRDHAIARADAANFLATELSDPEVVAEYAVHDLLMPMAVADRTLVAVSERLFVDGLAGDESARAFVRRPRVYLSSFAQSPDVAEGTTIVTDLALDDIGVVSAVEAGPELAARSRVWYGALQTALETELALQRAAAVEPSSRTVGSVSLDMPGPLTFVDPGDAGTLPSAAASLGAALSEGHVAVVVGDATEARSFWAIDPTTGATSSIQEPGLRYGYVAGGNYANAVVGGVRWVIDEFTANTLGFIKDGTYYRYVRTPPSRCSPGPEYTVILGCVSIPASWTLGVTIGATAVAVTAWSAALFLSIRAAR
jgi:hypothetical protein